MFPERSEGNETGVARPPAGRTGGTFLCLLGLLAAGLASFGAQIPAGRSVKGFQVAEQNPSAARESFLTGQDAVPLSKERFRITGLRLEIKENGRLSMLVEAPECFYDYAARSAWSSGPLHVKSGGDRIVLDGEGFEWKETNAVLVITNAVRAIVRRDLVQTNQPPAGAAAPAGPGRREGDVQVLEVRSDRFEYDANAHQVAFLGHTQVTDPSLEVACGRLLVELPSGEGAVQRIVAEEGVVLKGKQEGLVARADRADYRQSEDSLELTGHASWSLGDRSGRGGVIRVFRSTRSLRVGEGAFVRLPVRGAAGGFLVGEAEAGPRSEEVRADGFIEVESDVFTLEGNRAAFAGNVKALRRLAETEAGHLTCRELVATLGSSNRLERIEARDQVLIQESNRRATADEAVYTGEGILRLRGHPSWSFEGVEGRAEELVLDHPQRRFVAAPGAQVKMTVAAPEGARLFVLGPARQPPAEKATRRVVRVTAERLESTAGQATFVGAVRAEEEVGGRPSAVMTCDRLDFMFDPKTRLVKRVEASDRVVVRDESTADRGESAAGQLACERLSARFEGEGGALSSAVADGGVRWQEKGTLIEGERAEFEGGRDQVRLTGRPTVESSEARLLDAELILWDRGTGRYRATGKWRLEWKASAARKALESRG